MSGILNTSTLFYTHMTFQFDFEIVPTCCNIVILDDKFLLVQYSRYSPYYKWKLGQKKGKKKRKKMNINKTSTLSCWRIVPVVPVVAKEFLADWICLGVGTSKLLWCCGDQDLRVVTSLVPPRPRLSRGLSVRAERWGLFKRSAGVDGRPPPLPDERCWSICSRFCCLAAASI